MELAKSFEPAEIERRWYAQWEDAGYFKAGLDKSNPDAFCILLPPPNVTGTLHMGHGFNQTVMDALTRYHRMLGQNTLWQPGTDHAGIATQIVVERQLDAQGVSRHDLGREKFLEKVWEWKEYSGNTITQQMRRLGTSPDWSRERFTMDSGLSKTVTETFVRLFREGLIYRGKRLVNWDPVLHTAVSDLEVISEEEDGFLWHLHYPLTDGSGHLTVATTRPETMLGDTAVMVHPDDERYQHLIGKTVTLPLVNREVPIIADEYVDREFGTGVVKVTPAHDQNDYQVGLRHNLPMIIVLTLEGKIPSDGTVVINGQISAATPLPGELAGLDRFDARKAVVAGFETLGLLGESGSGKTVTLRALMRLLPPRRTRIEGTVRIEGHDILAMRSRALRDLRGGLVSMVFQEPMTALDPVYTVGQQIGETLRRHTGCDRRAARARALELLELVRIPSAERRLDAYPHELSGGLRQRAMIAMALSCKPRLLLADEPTTALDATVQVQVLVLLRRLQRELGMGMIFVTHDIGVAAEIADFVAVMYAGRIVESGAVARVLQAPAHPYTAGLLASTVHGQPRNRDIDAIPGSPPDLRRLPPGCSFAPRCPRRIADCGRAVPAPRFPEPGHMAACFAVVGPVGPAS